MHVQHTVSVHLDATLEQAWALISDPSRVPEWHTQCVAVRDIHEVPGHVGETEVYVMNVPGGQHDFQTEVTGWEELRSITVAGREVGGGQTWTSVQRFAPTGNGTDWTYELDSEIPGNRVVGVLAGKLIEGSIDRWMHKSMENFGELARNNLQPA